MTKELWKILSLSQKGPVKARKGHFALVKVGEERWQDLYTRDWLYIEEKVNNGAINLGLYYKGRLFWEHQKEQVLKISGYAFLRGMLIEQRKCFHACDA